MSRGPCHRNNGGRVLYGAALEVFNGVTLEGSEPILDHCSANACIPQAAYIAARENLVAQVRTHIQGIEVLALDPIL